MYVNAAAVSHTLCFVQVQQLVDMGFAYDAVSRALLSAGGDSNAALERLLGA